jgi:hypothetical protein
MLDEVIAVAAKAGQVCLGLVFLTAALQKFRHWRILEGVVANYRILPTVLAAPAARALPVVELALGLLLLSGFATPATAASGVALLGVFAGAMSVNLRRGRGHIDCGCHQSFLRQTLRWSLVWRNLTLALLLAPSLLTFAVADRGVWPVGVAAGACAFLFYLLFNALSSLPQPGPVAA